MRSLYLSKHWPKDYQRATEMKRSSLSLSLSVIHIHIINNDYMCAMLQNRFIALDIYNLSDSIVHYNSFVWKWCHFASMSVLKYKDTITINKGLFTYVRFMFQNVSITKKIEIWLLRWYSLYSLRPKILLSDLSFWLMHYLSFTLFLTLPEPKSCLSLVSEIV